MDSWKLECDTGSFTRKDHSGSRRQVEARVYMEKADTEKHTRMLLAEPRDDSELDDDSRNRFKKKKKRSGWIHNIF